MPSRKALQSERDADYAELRDSSDRHIAAAIGLVENASATVVSAIRARNALVLVRGKPTDQLPGPGRALNAVAVAAGWRDGDGGEFLDNYLRVTRRA